MRLFLAALAFFVTAITARADETNNNAVLATLSLPISGGPSAMDLSSDQQYLYLAVANSHATVGWKDDPEAENDLYVIDLADPRHPKISYSHKLQPAGPQEAVIQANRLFLLERLYRSTRNRNHLVIIDVRDPLNPKSLASIDFRNEVAYLRVSADGMHIALTEYKDDSKEGSALYIDVSDPNHPHPDTTTAFDNPAVAHGIAWYRREGEERGMDALVFEHFNSKILAFGPPLAILADGAGSDSRRIEKRFADYPIVLDARLLAARSAIVAYVADKRDGPFGLAVIDTTEAPYSADRLRSVGQAPPQGLLSEEGMFDYPLFGRDEIIGAMRWVSDMEQAGVRQLLNDASGPTLAERRTILTAYAFWLRQADLFGLTSTLRDQVSVLETVTKLVPQDPTAWHNLAEAASGFVRYMPDWTSKLQMAQTALTAFQHELDLTGKTREPQETLFLAVNPVTAPHDSVCNYIADFYNNDPEARYGRGNRHFDMFGYPDPVDIASDGHLVHVYTVQNNEQTYLAASAKPTPSTETRNIQSLVNFETPESGAPGDVTRAYVVPFKDGYYVLYERNGGPYDVVKPNKGPICSFKTVYVPTYEVNGRPVLCAQAGGGATYTGIPLKPLPPDTQSPFDLTGRPHDEVQLRGVQDVTLPNGTTTMFVAFDYMDARGGNVCPSSGVTYLDSSTDAAKKRATQLAMMERGVVGECWSSAFMIDVNGETMIDIEARRAADGRPASRALLRFSNDYPVPVCLIEPQPHYVPQSAKAQ